MRTLMRGGIGAFIVVRFCLPSLQPKSFPCRTLPWEIQNVVDKLFFCEESMVLSCFSEILPMLCPILIEPLFYQGFHTKDGLNFLLAHGHRPVRPLFSVFILFSCPLHPIWSVAFLCKGANWGDGKNNPNGSMFMGRRMRYRRERWKIQAKMTIVNIEWTVTQ